MTARVSADLPRTLLVMAGGTGGHIFPALSVARLLAARGWQVVWLGNASGMEGQLVPKHGFPLESVRFGGVRGKGLVTKFLLPLNLLRAFWQSLGVVAAGALLNGFSEYAGGQPADT
ncbi:glycosyltransferase, partial [Ralstonia pseudosolanacearum]|uniref:glycosyltransferase n=1 Tax=Ralstonia pseudosolanacearum TaxID=1310165 RepID=UPI003D184346